MFMCFLGVCVCVCVMFSMCLALFVCRSMGALSCVHCCELVVCSVLSLFRLVVVWCCV